MIRLIDQKLVDLMTPIEQNLKSDSRCFETLLPFGSGLLEDSLTDKIAASDGWNHVAYASMKDDVIIGRIDFYLNIIPRYAYHTTIINYEALNKICDKKDHSLSGLFLSDVMAAVDDILITRRYEKIKWLTFVRKNGHDHARAYHKLVDHIGGRVIGVSLRDNMLLNGEVVDKEEYEISAEEWSTWRAKKHSAR